MNTVPFSFKQQRSDADFILKEPVKKGMSGDEKYLVTAPDGRRFLLRLSPIEQYERKSAEYGMMETAYKNGVNVSKPFEFGLYQNERIYQLTQWCDGIDLEELLPQLSGHDAYKMGRKSAEVLLAIHKIPVQEKGEDWIERFVQKIRVRMDELPKALYACSDISFLFKFLNDNLFLLQHRIQCFNHGDYNPGNLIASEDGKFYVIDFNCYNLGYGDAIFELSVILLDENLSSSYKNGLLDTYFPQGLPKNFNRIMELYAAYWALSGLCECGEAERAFNQMQRLAQRLQTVHTPV